MAMVQEDTRQAYKEIGKQKVGLKICSLDGLSGADPVLPLDPSWLTSRPDELPWPKLPILQK